VPVAYKNDMLKVCILCEIISLLNEIHVWNKGKWKKSESWNTSISSALDKQVLFWWQQHYQHVWKPRYEANQDTDIVRNIDSYYVAVQHEPANLFWFLPQFYIMLLFGEWTDSVYQMVPAYLS
jgi:hypothetical protein